MRIKWDELAPLPVGISAHTAVLLHGSVYVGGGFEERITSNSKRSYRLHIYNLYANQWSICPITTPCRSFAMTVLDDKLIIAGGDNDNVPTNEVHVLDRGEWKYYSTMPTARTDLSAIGYQSMLITVGGQAIVNGEWTRVATTELLDTTNGCWYTCDILPAPCSQLKAAVVNSTLYLLGGFAAGLKPSHCVFTASLGNLSSHKLKWRTLPDIPWCLSTPVVLYNKFLLTVGGRQPHDDTSMTTEVCAFNSSTGIWKQIANIPLARSLPGIVSVSDDTFVMMGGANSQGEYICDMYIGQCM